MAVNDSEFLQHRWSINWSSLRLFYVAIPTAKIRMSFTVFKDHAKKLGGAI